MNEKNKIQEIIDQYPKHFSKMIQSREELWNWVNDNSLVDGNSAIKIYSALHQKTNVCDLGNIKRFISISHGFGYCGTAKKCECARLAVGEKVSKAKALRTPEQIEAENIKRSKTNLIKYGVTNTGQTEYAKARHDDFYQNHDAVSSVTTAIKESKKLRYGDPNYNNREKCISTNLKKYGFKNTWSLTEYKQNPNIAFLKDKKWLEEESNKTTVDEIATRLKVHRQTVFYYLGMHGLREPYKSTFEQELLQFLRSNGITNILSNKRNIIGKELDLYLPDHKLAIEYNGEYWHHIDIPHITKTYHYDKFIACEEQGITLFTIFGSSWQKNKEAWKEKILSKLQLTSKRVPARKTKVVNLSNEETKNFLNKHHIQGNCVSQYRYGLKFEGNVVAVMTFSKKRAGIGKQRTDNTYELVRYATSCSVIGGAGKLLSHFVKMNSPEQIVSYSDNQYSIGDLYKKLGFVMETETKGSYWYYDPANKVSYHRYKFTKHKLIEQGYDSNKTEAEIMNERGFLRIYDCGSRTWIYTIN